MAGKKLSQLPQTTTMAIGDLLLTRKTDATEYKITYQDFSRELKEFTDFTVSSTGSSYTLADVNNNQWMDLSGSSAITITCPSESSIDLSSKFNHVISNYSSGAVNIAAAAGATVHAPPGGTLVIPQYATVGIKKASHTTNVYIVYGPTEAI